MCDWISLSINWIEVYYYLSSWCSAVGSFRYLISSRRAMKRGMRRRRRRHFLFFMSFLILNNSLIASSREQSRDWRFIKLVFCAFLYSSFLSSLFFFLVEEWRICAYLGVAMEKIISTANNGDDFFWFDNRRAQLWNALSFWQLELNYQSQRKLRTKTREIEDDLLLKVVGKCLRWETWRSLMTQSRRKSARCCTLIFALSLSALHYECAEERRNKQPNSARLLMTQKCFQPLIFDCFLPLENKFLCAPKSFKFSINSDWFNLGPFSIVDRFLLQLLSGGEGNCYL